MFIVKYSSQGNALWALGTSGLNDGFLADLAITKTNDIIVSTSFVVGNVTFSGKPVLGFGGYDSFVASLSSTGDLHWIKSIGGVGSENPDYIEGVAVDSKDNIVITGFFESPRLQFDDFFVDAFSISENYFVVKFDKSGKTAWARGSQMPGDQSGFDVVVDPNDNIFVAGRFYNNETKFGSITLTSAGDGDAFIVQYDSNGDVVAAKNFGGTKFDSANKLALDNKGNIVVAGWYYSNTFKVDAFMASKTAFQSDLFIITFDNQLKAKCLKRVTGSAENFVDALHIDQANNTWIAVESIFLGGTTEFGGLPPVDHADFSSMFASLGDARSFDTTLETNEFPLVNLGNDIVKCKDKEVVLDAGNWCKGIYLWSDGSNERFLHTTQEGLFWAEVIFNGKIGRDSILVKDQPKLNLDLGKDLSMCNGTDFNLDVAQSQEATYTWENNSTSASRTINSAGLYWVKVVGRCEIEYDSIIVKIEPPIIFDLGNSRTICSNEPFVITTDIKEDYIFKWNDGSNSPQLTVSASGIYYLTVSNKCEAVSDSVAITLFDKNKLVIPNVLTANDDGTNDRFILPVDLVGSDIEVYNRWGNQVYQSPDYKNNWTGEDISPGVYFYLIKGSCLGDVYKGFIQILK